MKKIKLLALLMAIIMIVTVFAACGNGGGNNDTDTGNTASDTGDKGKAETTGENVGQSDYFNAVKIGELNEQGGLHYRNNSGAVVYYDDERNYGLISLDGKTDSGIKYGFCQEVDNKYYMVKEEKIESIDDIASLNKSGLVDGEGNVILPFEYAFFDDLSDRYIRVFTAAARTETKPETDYYMFFSDDIFVFSADEDDPMYTGSWKVFDLEKRAFVPGVEGKNGYNISVYGKYIKFVDDAIMDYRIVDENGVDVAEGASVLNMGEESWYILTDENFVRTVYNSDGVAVFSPTELGYSINGAKKDYFTASSYADGVSKNVLIDKTGKVVSAEFSEYISDIFGSIIYSGDKLYNFDGTPFIDGTYEYVSFDPVTEKYLFLQNGDQYTLIDTDGKVYTTLTKSDALSINTSSFSAYKRVDLDAFYYSVSDNDFTIKGESAVGAWLIKTRPSEDEYLYDLVDSFTGAVILSGYRDYRCVEADDGTRYVYAQSSISVSEKTYDIYVIETK